MIVVDAHLDLAYNALRGRPVWLPAAEQNPDDEGVPSVGLPDLRAGGVGLVCATIFCHPATEASPGYRSAQEAFEQAESQTAWYAHQEQIRRMTLIRSGQEIADVAAATTMQPLPAILLMEGADAMRTPEDVPLFFEAGMRIVGLAWRGTRYAGGTRAPGPLTPAGAALVRALDAVGMIHDVSHLAEESFWQLLDLSPGPILASHSNCRAIVPTDRQLSDDMIRALCRRGGVIGLNFFDHFLLPPELHGTRRATLADLVAHVRHVCDLAGDARHVALGSDMDGGFGQARIPVEIRTSADLPRVADALASAGLNDEQVCDIMGDNWLSFFGDHLPSAVSL